MVTIVLERVKGNQWDLRTKGGHYFCSACHETTHEAVDWCRNYMSSFDISYSLEVESKPKTQGRENYGSNSKKSS